MGVIPQVSCLLPILNRHDKFEISLHHWASQYVMSTELLRVIEQNKNSMRNFVVRFVYLTIC